MNEFMAGFILFCLVLFALLDVMTPELTFLQQPHYSARYRCDVSLFKAPFLLVWKEYRRGSRVTHAKVIFTFGGLS